jgi:hypothetical protein
LFRSCTPDAADRFGGFTPNAPSLVINCGDKPLNPIIDLIWFNTPNSAQRGRSLSPNKFGVVINRSNERTYRSLSLFGRFAPDLP